MPPVLYLPRIRNLAHELSRIGHAKHPPRRERCWSGPERPLASSIVLRGHRNLLPLGFSSRYDRLHMINPLLRSDAKPNRVSFYGLFIFLIHLLDLAGLVLCLPIFPEVNADPTSIL